MAAEELWNFGQREEAMSGIIIPVRLRPAAVGVGDVRPVGSLPPASPSSVSGDSGVSGSSGDRLPTKPRGSGWARAFVAVAVAGFVVMAVQLGVTAAFAHRIMPGVAVADVGVGGLTQPQAKAKLEPTLKGYRLDVVAAGASYRMTPAQAGISYNPDITVDQAYMAGRLHPLTWLAETIARPNHPLAYSYGVNVATQGALADQIAIASGQAPVDAALVIQNGVPTVQPDKNGLGLAAAAVETAINQAAATVSQPQPLRPTVLTARIRSADAAAAITATNQLIATPVTITYQSKSFQPTLAQRGQWIVFDKSSPNQPPGLIPRVDSNAIKGYLQTITPQINVAPVTQKVNVQNGVSQAYQAGQNGIVLNTDALATAIAAAVTAKQPLTTAAPTAPVPFQTQYNNSVPLPYDQYIEINLTNQHLWAYQDHQVVYDSPLTSGATGAGFPTATGLFAIYQKQTDRHLVGYQYGPRYNYDVFVQYWMAFYQGFGLHDASWRSSFGGPDYYYDGSHGCVNLPLATAAWLYGWSGVGTPVWVHN